MLDFMIQREIRAQAQISTDLLQDKFKLNSGSFVDWMHSDIPK